MKKYNKKTLIIFLIIVIISASFVFSQISGAKAQSKPTTALSTQESGEPALTGYSESDSMYPALLKLLGALVLIVGLIYGFIFLLRKMMGPKAAGSNGEKVLEVIETAYVGQKKSVSLIRFADRSVLVGMGDNAISVLAELSQDETNKIVSDCKVEKKTTSFGQAFSEARKKLTQQFNGGGKLSRLDVEQANATQSVS